LTPKPSEGSPGLRSGKAQLSTSTAESSVVIAVLKVRMSNRRRGLLAVVVEGDDGVAGLVLRPCQRGLNWLLRVAARQLALLHPMDQHSTIGAMVSS
jgi:hypothetical protein